MFSYSNHCLFFFYNRFNSFNLNITEYDLIYTKLMEELGKARDDGVIPTHRIERPLQMEKFRWILKRDNKIVRQSKVWYLSMRSCRTDAENFHREDTSLHCDYEIEVFDSPSPVDLIFRVFMYIFSSEYTIRVSKICEGCIDEEYKHESFCYINSNCKVDLGISKVAQNRISINRLYDATCFIAHYYGSNRNDIHLHQIRTMLNNLEGGDYQKSVEMSFEKELMQIDSM